MRSHRLGHRRVRGRVDARRPSVRAGAERRSRRPPHDPRSAGTAMPPPARRLSTAASVPSASRRTSSMRTRITSAWPSRLRATSPVAARSTSTSGAARAMSACSDEHVGHDRPALARGTDDDVGEGEGERQLVGGDDTVRHADGHLAPARRVHQHRVHAAAAQFPDARDGEVPGADDQRLSHRQPRGPLGDRVERSGSDGGGIHSEPLTRQPRDADRVLEADVQRSRGRADGPGRRERISHLPGDLDLADHCRLEAGGHPEQVLQRIDSPVAAGQCGDVLGGQVGALGQGIDEGTMRVVEARAVEVRLDPGACAEHDDAAHGGLVGEPPDQGVDTPAEACDGRRRCVPMIDTEDEHQAARRSAAATRDSMTSRSSSSAKSGRVTARCSGRSRDPVGQDPGEQHERADHRLPTGLLLEPCDRGRDVGLAPATRRPRRRARAGDPPTPPRAARRPAAPPRRTCRRSPGRPVPSGRPRSSAASRAPSGPIESVTSSSRPDDASASSTACGTSTRAWNALLRNAGTTTARRTPSAARSAATCASVGSSCCRNAARTVVPKVRASSRAARAWVASPERLSGLPCASRITVVTTPAPRTRAGARLRRRRR